MEVFTIFPPTQNQISFAFFYISLRFCAWITLFLWAFQKCLKPISLYVCYEGKKTHLFDWKLFGGEQKNLHSC